MFISDGNADLNREFVEYGNDILVRGLPSNVSVSMYSDSMLKISVGLSVAMQLLDIDDVIDLVEDNYTAVYNMSRSNGVSLLKPWSYKDVVVSISGSVLSYMVYL